MQVRSPTGETYTVADDNTVYDANNTAIGYVDPSSGSYVANDGASVSLAELATQGFLFSDSYDVSGGADSEAVGLAVLPVGDEPASVGSPTVFEAPEGGGAQAAAMATDLLDPSFVPENATLAQIAAQALDGLATAYTPETADQLDGALNHWLGVGQHVLDAGTWVDPTSSQSPGSDAASSGESDGMSEAERARRASYAALGMSPEQIDAEYERMRASFASIGIDIDDVRMAASAPGRSALDWAEETLAANSTNVEGIVGVRMDSGIASLQAAAADRVGGFGQAPGAGYLQSSLGYGSYDAEEGEAAATERPGSGQSAMTVEEMIEQMSPAPMYSPIEIAVGDLYAEYTMRDLPLYCFEYSERLRDQLAQNAPESNPVVIEYPSSEENGMNHYAVQIDTAAGPMVIDVTADQFAILNGQDRVGPEMKTREQMEYDMRERGFRDGRVADTSTPPEGGS